MIPNYQEFVAFKKQTNDSQSTEDDNNSDQEITPDETLRAAYKKINDPLAQDILDRTRKVTPAFFEDLLIELLVAIGYGGSGEDAAHALGNNVSAGDIRNFFGALNLKKAQKGIFITTSDFT
ncbi:restriction endonuclease [Pseudoalteromonas sp. B62]|uniref:restriction endonuclease n=1 Tax=Pseudoalteromonas sp. B62 TaxID=630483 RepID=UPI00301D4ED1